VFLSGTPEGALYWAKLAYQRTHEEDMEAYDFDRDHGHEIGQLLAILVVEIPANKTKKLMADEEQFEDVHANFSPKDWKQSLKAIGDVRFDGPIPPGWVKEVIRPTAIQRGSKGNKLGGFEKERGRMLKRRLLRHQYAKNLIDPKAIAVCLYRPETEHEYEKWYAITPGFPYDEGVWRVSVWDKHGPLTHYSAAMHYGPFLTVLQAVDDVLFEYRHARVVEYILPSGEHVRVGRGPSCF
jgi:hypothetical protein